MTSEIPVPRQESYRKLTPVEVGMHQSEIH
jgi:hypothetical protein